MTEMDAAVDDAALVPGAHRLIRAVDGAEGPFAGSLVVYDSGVAVAVDAGELADWGGWRSSDADHVCGVIDLRRRKDGQDALLPWCTQRIETFLGRRLAANAPLAPGETATLAVSLIRGVRELGVDAADAIGEWWLTGDGRPLFVHGDGGGARGRTAALVERISAHTTDRATLRILGEMITALRERRHHHDDDVRWEEQLFATAAPRALQLDVFAPEKAADLVPRRSLRAEPDEPRRTRRVRRDMLQRFRHAVVERAVALVALVPRRGDRSPHPRRRMTIVAGSLAALVLTIGLMWPEGDEPEAAIAVQTPTDERTEAPVEQADAEPLPLPDAEAIAAVPMLLDSIAECVESAVESCPEALSDGLSTPAAGYAVQGSKGSAATLVDDYGDVAVVKLQPVDPDEGAAEQMLVLERQNEKWLVRDIYDVAHQPDQAG